MQTRSAKKELGDILIDKGIIQPDVLERALEVLNKEENKGRRKLPQILVDQFKMDRDLVYREVADYYAFRTLDISMETIDDGVLGFIRKELTSLPESIREMVQENNVLPYSIDPERPGRLLVITPDPTKPEVYKIARTFHYQKFEICYVPLSQWDRLMEKSKPRQSGLQRQGIDAARGILC